MSQIKINSFICDDCMNVMRELPDNFCDLILTDPPYGIKDWNDRGTNILRSFKAVEFKKWDLKPSKKVFSEMLRISQNQIVWGGNHFFKYLGNTKQLLVWDKCFRGMHFNDCEIAWCSEILQACRIYTHSTVANKIHPTQKPVALFVWCLNNYSKPGDLIIDPFCGSGTTALACHKTGRRFICIDKEPEYIKIAEKRYKELVAQQDLFGSESFETDKTDHQQPKATTQGSLFDGQPEQ